MSPPLETFKLTPRVMALTTLVMLATVMQALDTTVANVALPHMQGSMSASQDQITWVLTSYVVTAAIFTSLTGFLVGRYGRTRVFFFSVAGFTIASMLCGAAQSLEQIVLFRMLQGALGALLIPLSQAVLMDVFPSEKHGVAMAIWGMGVMLGPIFGPSLGGWLTDNYSWRWVFYINLPFGILAAIGVVLLLPETKRDSKFHFDMLGFVLLSLAVGSLQMMLDRGTTLDWFSSVEVTIEAIVAAVCLYLFIVHMMTSPRAFLSTKPFRDINYTLGLLLSFVTGLALYSTLALMPPLLQNLLGYPVISVGILLMPRGIGTLVAMAVVGRLVRRVDARILILIGFALTTLSLWQMTQFSLKVTSDTIFWSGMLQGFGIGLIFVPLTTVSFATLDPKYRTESAALFALIRSIGSSFGIAGVSSMLARNSQINHADLVQHITPYSQALQALAPNGLWNLGGARGLAVLNSEIDRQAAMIAYIDIFLALTYMAVLSMPLVLLLRPPKNTPLPKSQMVAEH